jgi:arylsulfatase A-like enzyme
MWTRRAWLGAAAVAPAILKAQDRKPNILFLIADDLSWDGLACYGNTAVQTPNLDRLAIEGMRFENCFVSSAQCSPNRSSIFTGCTPHTTSTSRLHTPMPEWEPSILEPLKQAGYFTGAMRKVHQGEDFNKRFDFYTQDPKAPFEKFFDAVPQGKPFWFQFGSTDPHRPYRPGAFSPAHDPAKVRVPAFLPDHPEVRKDLAIYHDYTARFDKECGQVLALLEKRGMLENTLIVVTGDNGMPFPRAKGTCYDPGLRVPLLIKWPRKVKPSVKRELIAHVDLAPTWLDAAGLPVPKKMQGRSFLPLLTGGEYKPNTEVFSERNWHDNFDPIRSVRTDRYKLIINAAPHVPYRPAWDLADSPSWKTIQDLGRRGNLTPAQIRMLDPSRPAAELYDLQKDPDEFNNLATSPAHREVYDDLMRRLSAWMSRTYDYLPPGRNPKQGSNWPVLL